MISLLTPTGGRPEAFAACVEMMRAQTYAGPVLWVIVDDGPEPMAEPSLKGWDILTLRPRPHWKPGQNTLARNLLYGLGGWAREGVAIIEDDDEYAPWWVERCAERLKEADLIGESHSLYKHRVTGRTLKCRNDRHASLCSTALKGAAVDALRDTCRQGGKGIDLRFWRDFSGSKRLFRPEPRGVTGIKGWPGRPGIGIGHRL